MSSLRSWGGDFSKEKDKLRDYIRNQSFLVQTELFLPGVNDNSQQTEEEGADFDVLADYSYHYVTCHLSDLLTLDFLSQIEGRFFSAISANTPVDRSNSVCISPSLHLSMLVDKDTYLELGLSGSASLCGLYFTVVIDLSSACYRSGSRYYERVQWCMSRSRLGEVKLLVCTSSSGCQDSGDGNNSQPSTELEFPEGCAVEKVEVQRSSHEFDDIYTPCLDNWRFCDEVRKPSAISSTDTISLSGSSVQGTQECMEDLLGWLGAMSLRLHTQLSRRPPNCFTSTYITPSVLPVAGPCRALARRWRVPLLPTVAVERAVERARHAVQSGQAPWAAVLVWGLHDAPRRTHSPTSVDSGRPNGSRGDERPGNLRGTHVVGDAGVAGPTGPYNDDDGVKDETRPRKQARQRGGTTAQQVYDNYAVVLLPSRPATTANGGSATGSTEFLYLTF